MTAEQHWEAKLGWKPTPVCFAPATNYPKSLQDRAGEGNAAEQTDARAAAAPQWQVCSDGATTKFWRNSSTGDFPARQSGNAASFRMEELEGNGSRKE